MPSLLSRLSDKYAHLRHTLPACLPASASYYKRRAKRVCRNHLRMIPRHCLQTPTGYRERVIRSARVPRVARVSREPGSRQSFRSASFGLRSVSWITRYTRRARSRRDVDNRITAGVMFLDARCGFAEFNNISALHYTACKLAGIIATRRVISFLVTLEALIVIFRFAIWV